MQLAHSKLGPSASDRWLNCPGSITATANAPDSTSKFAAEGTAAHMLSEWARDEGKPCRHWVGHKIEVEGYEFEVTSAMADHVQDFVDYVEALPGDAYVEERVSYDAWVPGGFGTADDVRIDEDTCYVTDLKFGKGIQVFAKENAQLKMYALGCFQEHGHLYDIQKFVLAIHQPRLEHVDVWEISVNELLQWVQDTVLPALEDGKSENPTFRAGKWCQFCAIKNTCETRTETMQADWAADFDGPEAIAADPDKLAEILDRLPAIRAWCNDIEAYAFSQVQKGNAVGDWKVVEGRSNRAWVDPEQAEQVLRKRGKLKVAEVYERKLISPTQAEKILGKKHPALQDLIRKPPGKPVFVPGSDSRPPLQVSAEDEFSDLGNADKE